MSVSLRHPAPVVTVALPEQDAGAERGQGLRWPLLFATVALCLYVAVAVWLLYGLHYEIGDAVARSAHARAVIQSRDPHLASMGFYWPPLPVLLQAPLMVVLGGLGHGALAGPLMTAACGALTVIVVARVCHSVGLSRGFSMALTAVYALNPVTVFTAANGMSESVFLLFAAIAMLGYLRWTSERRTVDLVTLAAGLAGAVTVRYEALPFIVVLTLAVMLASLRSPLDLRDPATRRTVLASGVLAAAPALYTFGLWLFASLLIMKDPFYWLTAQAANGRTPADAAWLPHPLSVASIFAYCGRLALAMAPGTVAIAPLLVLRRTWTGFVTGLGLLGALLMWPALIVYQLIARVTYADPRYFEPAVLFITVAAAWATAEHQQLSRAGRAAIIAALAIGGVTATSALAAPTPYVEHERVFFGSLLGRPESNFANGVLVPDQRAWRQLTTALDERLDVEPATVMLDTRSAAQAFLLTRHPRDYIIPADRDFDEIVADPRGRVDFLIQTPTGALVGAFDTILASRAGGEWRPFGDDYGVARVYEWIPTEPTSNKRGP